MKKYDASSIKSLSFVEGVRLRVGMYLGSSDSDGVLHSLIEVVNNSVDEVIAGYGKRITITIGEKWFSVEDEGRGIPIGSNRSSEDVLVDMLTTSHSGGKFEEGAYENARGLNGVGIGTVSASSSQFEIISRREGYEWKLSTVKGIPTSKTQKGSKTAKTGTFVKAYPDPEVFSSEEVKIDFDKVSELIKEYAYFSPTCEFIVKNADTNEVNKYWFKNGIKDFAKDKITNKLHNNYIYNKVIENGVEIEVIAQWTKGKENIYTFVNGGNTPEGGTPVTGLKSAVTTRVNSELQSRINGDTIRKGLVVVMSIKHPSPLFGNQTKTKISNPELRGLASKAILEGIDKFKEMNREEYSKLLEMIQKTEKAERAAELARERVLNTEREIMESSRKGNIDLPEKVVDATNKTGYRELFLTEGDSASGFLKATRDAATQGVMPLRGKILNTFDLDLPDAYENEEVKAIFTLLGAGAGSKFNINKLRYDKVIIATDADSDGDHISLLLIALFLKHSPKLIESGKLYRVLAPFYGLSHQGRYKVFYSEEEFAEFENKYGKQTKVDRYKGLGAMNEDLVEKYVMSNERKLVQIKMSDIDEMIELFETLLGKNIEGRRKLVRTGEIE